MRYTYARHPQGFQEGDSTLLDLTTRYWVSIVLMFPLALIALRDVLPIFKQTEVAIRALALAEFMLATPVLLWCGKPVFIHAWRGLRDRSLDLLVFIGIFAGAAYLYSVANLFLQTMISGPSLFGASAMLVTLGLYWRLHGLEEEGPAG